MAEVHLRADDCPIAAKDLAEVGGHRVEMSQLGMGHFHTAAACASAGLADRPVGTAPAQHQQFRVAGRVVDRQIGYLDAVDLGLPQSDHLIVVGPEVGDVTGTVGLLQAADTVLQAGRSRDGELPGQGLRVTGIRLKVGTRLREPDINGGEGLQVWDPPRFGTISDRAVGQQDDRRAVGQRDAGGLDGNLEAVRR